MNNEQRKTEEISCQDMVPLYVEEIEKRIARRRKYCKDIVEVLSYLVKGATELSADAFIMLVNTFDEGGFDLIRTSVYERVKRKQGGGRK